jgi:hypothetical protein
MNVNSMYTARGRTIIHWSSPSHPNVTGPVTLRNDATEPIGGRNGGKGHASILAEKAALRELSALFR